MRPVTQVTPPGSLVWRVLHFPPILLVVAFLMLAAGRQVVRMVGIKPHITDIRVALSAAVFTVAVFVLVYWLFVRFVERRPRVEELSLRRSHWELGAGLLIGFASFSIVIAIITAFGGYRIIGCNPVSVVLPVLVLALKSGVIEEIVTRGILFRITEQWLGSWIAIMLTSAAFGAAHLGNPGATWWSAVAVGVEGGLVSGALFMLTRRLWGVIGEHFAWNFTEGGLYGVPVSGLTAAGLFQARVQGSEALTGGAFGAEASLPVLFIEIAVGMSLMFFVRRHKRFIKPVWKRTRAKVLRQP